MAAQKINDLYNSPIESNEEGNFLTESNEDENNYNFFLRTNQHCLKLRNTDLTDEELAELQQTFVTQFPNKCFEEFLEKCKTQNEDPCFNLPIYDTRTKRSYIPKIIAPVRKKNIENFNITEFIKDMLSKHEMHYLNIDSDPDIDFDFDDIYENRKKQLIMSDQANKSIATLILFINQQRKEIPYSLMEVNAEKYIN